MTSPVAKTRVEQLIAADTGVLDLFGLSVAEVDEGEVVMEMTVNENMINSQGFCHGGVLYTLADTTAAYVCGSLGLNSATIDAQVKYFKPATVHGKVKARGKVVKPYSKIIHVNVQLDSGDGQVCAEYQGTFYNRGSLGG